MFWVEWVIALGAIGIGFFSLHRLCVNSRMHDRHISASEECEKIIRERGFRSQNEALEVAAAILADQPEEALKVLKRG